MQDKISKLKFFFSSNKKSSIKVGLSIGFFISIFYVNYLFLFHPFALDQQIKKFKNKKPKTLQRVKGSILGDKLDIHVIKIKYENKIYLDFFSKQENDSFYLMDSLTLRGKNDGFFEYWDDALSLALLDEDGDGLLEIIAPTFDEFFKPHLNVIFYNKKKKKFEIKSSPQLKPQIK